MKQTQSCDVFLVILPDSTKLSLFFSLPLPHSPIPKQSIYFIEGIKMDYAQNLLHFSNLQFHIAIYSLVRMNLWKILAEMNHWCRLMKIGSRSRHMNS